jgi:hypothetical protein
VVGHSSAQSNDAVQSPGRSDLNAMTVAPETSVLLHPTFEATTHLDPAHDAVAASGRPSPAVMTPSNFDDQEPPPRVILNDISSSCRKLVSGFTLPMLDGLEWGRPSSPSSPPSSPTASSPFPPKRFVLPTKPANEPVFDHEAALFDLYDLLDEVDCQGLKSIKMRKREVFKEITAALLALYQSIDNLLEAQSQMEYEGSRGSESGDMEMEVEVEMNPAEQDEDTQGQDPTDSSFVAPQTSESTSLPPIIAPNP